MTDFNLQPKHTRHPDFVAPVTAVHGESRAQKVYVREHLRGVQLIPEHYRESPTREAPPISPLQS